MDNFSNRRTQNAFIPDEPLFLGTPDIPISVYVAEKRGGCRGRRSNYIFIGKCFRYFRCRKKHGEFNSALVQCLLDSLKQIAHQRGRLVPTELGKSIFDDKDGFDPYLDDPATLWLIHWQISTNINQATAWYWAFNILRESQFAVETL